MRVFPFSTRSSPGAFRGSWNYGCHRNGLLNSIALVVFVLFWRTHCWSFANYSAKGEEKTPIDIMIAWVRMI